MINENQRYVLYKAKMLYEEAKGKQNAHCDKTATAKSSMRKWGEELDMLNNKLAAEAVEYIRVLQEANERLNYEVEMLNDKINNKASNNMNSPPLETIAHPPPPSAIYSNKQ